MRNFFSVLAMPLILTSLQNSVCWFINGCEVVSSRLGGIGLATAHVMSAKVAAESYKKLKAE